MKQTFKLKKHLRQLLLLVCFFAPLAIANAGNEQVITTNTANATVTFTNSSYGWAWDSSNSRLQSDNYHKDGTTAKMTISIVLPSSCKFSFDYAVSSESDYDEFSITLDGTTIVNAISGTQSSSFSQEIEGGTHTLVLSYVKDGSDESGADRAYVSNMQFVGKTKIGWGSCGDDVSYAVYGDGSLVISGTGDITDYSMGLSPLNTFKDNITTITVEEGITTLGNNIFYGLSKATSVSLPSSLTSIGDGAFILCKELAAVTIPGAVTNIGNSAFQNCTGLTTVTIPENVANLGYAVFRECI